MDFVLTANQESILRQASESGIHNHRREYGFRAHANRHVPE